MHFCATHSANQLTDNEHFLIVFIIFNIKIYKKKIVNDLLNEILAIFNSCAKTTLLTSFAKHVFFVPFFFCFSHTISNLDSSPEWAEWPVQWSVSAIIYDTTCMCVCVCYTASKQIITCGDNKTYLQGLRLSTSWVFSKRIRRDNNCMCAT